jgi:hypothetical protein
MTLTIMTFNITINKMLNGRAFTLSVISAECHL